MTPAPGRLALEALALVLAGCATFAPTLRGVHRADRGGHQSLRPAVVALVGDIGEREAHAAELVGRIERRLAGAPDAPVLVLGDVFYAAGLLGLCPAGNGSGSRRGCEERGEPEEQLEAVFAPYRRAFAQRPLVAIAGNHDHYGDPDSTANACRLLPPQGRDWRYLALGCGIDSSQAVATLETPALSVVLLDSERMIQDAAFRERAALALRAELARLRQARPEQWRVVAAHHPLESYGSHNGAGLPGSLHKDLYWLRRTLLWPLLYPLERSFAWVGAQDVFEWRYRAYRRALYAVFRDEPIDLYVAGHDHNLQWIEIDHPGVRWTAISGSAAKRNPLQRFGLDLLWTNRLARLLGLRQLVPAYRTRLHFASGADGRSALRSGHGFAVIVPEDTRLAVEFYDAASDEPLYVGEVRR